MKRSGLVFTVVTMLGALAGVAVAGRPASVAQMTIPVSATTVLTSTSINTAAEPSTTSVPGLDPTTVRVIVANGTDSAGIAAANATTLRGAGFTNSEPVDALGAIATTIVYYRPGFKEAALSVAGALALPTSTVQALPAEPITRADDLGDVIVAVGTDFAS